MAQEIRLVSFYLPEDCENCGRHRMQKLVLGNGHEYSVCEKCNWIKEQKRRCEKDCYDFAKLNRHYKWVYFLKEGEDDE